MEGGGAPAVGGGGMTRRLGTCSWNLFTCRYPDDPFDRIWISDLVRPLGMAGGTRRRATTRPVFVGTQEEPPQRVMQTAVVGQSGLLSYQFMSELPRGKSWMATYFAEIEDLAPTETRNFTVNVSDWPEYSGLTIDVAAQAGGKYRLYEPRYINVSVHQLFFLNLRRRDDFSNGPIINAIEIYTYLPMTADDGKLARRRRRAITIAVCTASGALLLLIGAAIGCCCYLRRKKNPPPHAQEEEELGLIQTAIGRYTLSEIEEATNGFERRIGSGGFADVYYGKLADGREIAAKSLMNPQESVNEFTNEVTLLSRVHHRNLVSFLGYSQQSEKSILVYEFMHSGTLKQHLPEPVGEEGERGQKWPTRGN